MVLKKPYAFLIKHFKLIHLLLCIPFIYLIIRVGAIASFFSDYVRANYYTNVVNIPGTYINYFMYGAILLVILLSLAIYFLMKQKEKDTKFYMGIIVYYILLFILLSVCYGILGSIESASIEAQTVRIYRDITYIIYIPQFFFAGYSLLRGIGFDLKKFNFDQDVKELEITDIDSEEFELEFGRHVDEYKRTFRRFIREFRYYVLENKFTFSVLASIFVVVIGTILYFNFGVYNKTYRETEKMSHNRLLVSVEDSVLSNLSAGGKKISDNYYLAISLKIKNNGMTASSLDYENFQVEVANRLISATLDRASYFPEMGLPYTRDTSISPGEENVYVLTYEIDSLFLNEPIVLKILDTLTFEIGSITPIYKTVHLKYDKVLENKAVREYDLGKILELSNTFLGLSRLQFKQFQLMNSYEYSYDSCSFEVCQTIKNKVTSSSKNTLLVLDRFFELDSNSLYYKSRKGENSFVNDFLSVRYTLYDNTYHTTVQNVTPKELQDTWVFEVPKNIMNATAIDVLVTIRGSVYAMKLK